MAGPCASIRWGYFLFIATVVKTSLEGVPQQPMFICTLNQQVLIFWGEQRFWVHTLDYDGSLDYFSFRFSGR